MTDEPFVSIADMMKEEPLLPEFRRFLIEHDGLGQVFHHPLYISAPYFTMENARINKVIPYRLRMIEQWKAERNWTRILAQHERPYRLDAFTELESLLTDEEFWDEVSWLWTDSNNIFQNQKGWRRLMLSKRPCRERLMTDDEHKTLAELPDRIQVYRGTQVFPQGCRGMSWTRDRNIAIRFATRGRTRDAIPTLVTATVRKRDVLAYFDDRDEDEIVTLPEKIRNADVKRL